MNNKDIIEGRCSWCGKDKDYQDYHDNEWGKPVYEEGVLFEFIVLEGAQSGLSWITILRKREGYRKAFRNFDTQQIIQMNEKDIELLMENTGIIRNRLKIKSVITNAQRFTEIQKEYKTFREYILSFFPEEKPIVNHWKQLKEAPTTTFISDKISKDMKKRGFKFFGSTTCYSFLQATGFINDHLIDCKYR